MNKVVDFVRDAGVKSITFTEFPDQFAREYRSRELSWDDVCLMIKNAGPFASKGDAPWVKLAEFSGVSTSKGCYRHNAGVVRVTGVECDYDDEVLGVEEAAKKLRDAEISCFIYTSGSHRAGAPRFRVLAPLSSGYKGSEAEMKAYRSVMIKRIETVLGVSFSSESHTLSQAYYYGQVEGVEFRTFAIEGEYVDVRWDLDSEEGAETPLETYTRVDRAGLIADVLTERAYHTSLRSLAAAGASDGYDFDYISNYLYAVMDSVPEKGPKWSDRRESIPGLVRSALRKYGSGSGSEGVERYRDTFGGVAISRLGLMEARDVNPFTFVIDRMMPAAVMGIAGAGGSAKSTMVLWAMVHILTGRSVFGYEVLKQGACVFVTAEDEREIVVHRVHRMCEALGLSEAELDAVAEGLYVEDVSGSVCRLVESQRDGNLSFSSAVDSLVRTYKGKEVAFIAFDPATYFGAGERFVNDGEALMRSAGRRIAKELECCVAFVHHVGKQAGREKTLDQYSGRGGSAFADNSRAMWSMARYERGDSGVGAIPEEIAEMIDEGCQVSRLIVTKMSYGKKIDETLWIGRDRHNDWEFHTHWATLEDAVRTTKATKEEADVANDEIIGLIVAEIDRQLGEGHYPNVRSMRAANIMHNEKKVSQVNITKLIQLGIVKNRIVEEELPPHLVRGARKTFLRSFSLVVDSKPIEEISGEFGPEMLV